MPLCGILNLSSGSSCIIISNCVRAFVQPFVILHESVHLSNSLEFYVGICNELLEFVSYATRNCLLHEISSRPCHSDCCPCVIPLHVLLVFVIPRSTNCDSLIELGRSLTFAILISASQELHQTSKPSRSQMLLSVTSGLSCE